jgi:ABC-type glutathione transport system ATPase component
VNAEMTAHPLPASDDLAHLHGSILERYRREVHEVFGELSIQRLPETRHDIGRLRLDQIFIRLRLKRRNRPTVYSDESGAGESQLGFRHRIRPIDLLRREARGRQPAEESELERRLEEERFAQEVTESKPVDLAHAIAESRHVVIVGAPGSGKTTLTRWLAVTFAQDLQGAPERLGAAFQHPRLPVVIELRRLARWIRGARSLARCRRYSSATRALPCG